MAYLFREYNDIYAVWLADNNRYILLKKPAFVVFSSWANGISASEIACEVAGNYGLSIPEAEKFTSEIIAGVTGLKGEESHKAGTILPSDLFKKRQNPYSVKDYHFGRSIVRISYGHQIIESFIHPKFQHLAVTPGHSDVRHTYELTGSGGRYYLVIDGQLAGHNTFSKFEELEGALYLQMLDTIYGATLNDWMGVFHAAAVTDEKNAILFAGTSGSGKSTVAALLNAQGFKILTDDFLAVLISAPEICAFPGAISVKEDAKSMMEEYFSAHGRQFNIYCNGSRNNAGYMAPVEGEFVPCRIPAKALVFLEREAGSGVRLERVANHEVMNNLLREAWIAGNPVAAGRFLDWYFSLPCYTLSYSDSQAMVDTVRELFG